ncbi:MAG: hypothetical protein R3B06_25550 [Kofleriaceae bacterium]
MTTTPFARCALALALAACGSKKSSPAEGTGSAAAPPAVPAPRPPPPPPQPLPPLAADPGDATGAVEVVTAFGGTGTDSTRAIAVAPDGGAYVAGYFDGVATFPPLSVTGAGKSDAFVARVGADGAFAWVTPVASANEDTAEALAVGADGAVTIGGLFSAELHLGDLAATAGGSDDLFVASVTAGGEPRWLWTAGGPGSDAVTALAATPDGGYVVGVSFYGKVKFGSIEAEAKGFDDAALIKLSSAGAVEWVTPIAGDGSEQIKRLAVDGNGDIFLLGTFQQSIDLGGGPLNSAGAMDLLIARFDASGRHVWSKRAGNPWNEVAGGIAVDRAGGVVITGSFDRDLDFLGTPLVAAGESDVLVARLTGDGALVWANRFGSEREDIGYGIGVDDAGNAVVTGWFESPVDFGNGRLKGKGQKDGFVAKFSAAGPAVWSRRFGDWDNDSGNAVAVAPNGTIWLTGIFRYQLDLATPTVTARSEPGARIARPDAFVARLSR